MARPRRLHRSPSSTNPIRPDSTFRDEFTIERGDWEAEDTDDDLEAEIKKKIKRGYRLTNTIFEDTRVGKARLATLRQIAQVLRLDRRDDACVRHPLSLYPRWFGQSARRAT